MPCKVPNTVVMCVLYLNLGGIMPIHRKLDGQNTRNKQKHVTISEKLLPKELITLNQEQCYKLKLTFFLSTKDEKKVNVGQKEQVKKNIVYHIFLLTSLVELFLMKSFVCGVTVMHRNNYNYKRQNVQNRGLYSNA